MQTIELNGRPIAVMGGSRDQAEEFAEGDGFRTDLLTFLDSDGCPLWDTRGQLIVIRHALVKASIEFTANPLGARLRTVGPT